jgi:hypothetical protein
MSTGALTGRIAQLDHRVAAANGFDIYCSLD